MPTVEESAKLTPLGDTFLYFIIAPLLFFFIASGTAPKFMVFAEFQSGRNVFGEVFVPFADFGPPLFGGNSMSSTKSLSRVSI